MIKPNWDIFKVKFNEKQQVNFEWFCYTLFCTEFKQEEGISRFKNQSGMETDPIKVGNDYISWEAKFYTTEEKLSSNIIELKKKIDISKEKNPELTKLYFYTPIDWSESSRKNERKTDKQKEVEEYAKNKDIKIVWKGASFFESPFVCVKNEKIASHFFTDNEKIKQTVRLESIDNKLKILVQQAEEEKQPDHDFKTELPKGFNKEMENETEKLFGNRKFNEVRKIADEYINKHKSVMQGLAKAHYQKALTYEAEMNYPKAKMELKSAIGFDSANPDILGGYGRMIIMTGDSKKEALFYYEEALKMSKEFFSKDELMIANSYIKAGNVLLDYGKNSKAIEYLDEAEQLLRKMEHNKDAKVLLANAYNSLANVYLDKGGKGIPLAEKYIKKGINIFGEKYPEVCYLYHTLAIIYDKKKKYKDAIKSEKKAIKFLHKIYGSEEDPIFATAYANLGQYFNLDGDIPESKKNYEKAIRILEQAFPDGHTNINVIKKDLSNMLLEQLSDEQLIIGHLRKYEEAFIEKGKYNPVAFSSSKKIDHSIIKRQLEKLSQKLGIKFEMREIKQDEELYWVQISVSKKVGRNEKCPCGSGKKFKKCCG